MIYRWTAILYMGTRGFLMALKKIDSEYARIRLIWMAQANKLNVFDEIRAYRRYWEILTSGEQKDMFATLKGQSSDQLNSDSTNQNNQNRGIKRPKRDDCPCGDDISLINVRMPSNRSG